jgi:hypothetical protein
MIAYIDVTSRKGETIMITQQHDNEIQQKVQASSPVKLHRWVVVLLSILGVVLPLVVGLMVWVPWPMMDLTILIFFWGFSSLVSVAVGAFLLCFTFRTWWVAMFAGIAWVVGELLSRIGRTVIDTGWYTLQTGDFWSAQFSFLWPVSLLLLLLAMAVGAVCGLTLWRRRAAR